MNDKKQQKKKYEYKCMEFQNNKKCKINIHECLLKRIFLQYCPRNGHELLSALEVGVASHASSVFLVLKPPLSMID